MPQPYRDKLYDFLLQAHILPPVVLKSAREQANQEGIPLERVLTRKDLIDNATLGKIISDLLELPLIFLNQVSIPTTTLQIIPEVFARQHQLIVFSKNDHGVSVASCRPQNEQKAIDQIAKKTGLPITVYYATEDDIYQAFSLYATGLLHKLTMAIEQESESKNPDTVIRVVDMLLAYAYQNKASDIHIDPDHDGALIRFRIDGILHDIVQIPESIYQHIATRIKVLSGIRIDKHQTPQDGTILFTAEGEQVDVRVSVVPTTSGENIVMRLLSESSRRFSLHALGLSPENLAKIQKACKKSQGMLISSGPTGSGKTTTMYAILKLLNQPGVNIMTIEDPVEYQIDRVRQIQVNAQTGLTFANGLRSILRQDPNIILVGEIRDRETADIAVNSSLTGHLLLSTLHTNDASTALPRIVDMGIEPYLVASSVNTIIAQRLVRTICNSCRASHYITEKEKVRLKQLGISYDDLNTYKGKGCQACFNTGYRGRTGIFEILEVNTAMQTAITNKQNTSALRELAKQNGMTTMLEDGLDKVKKGITSIEEVIEVASDEP